MERDPRSAAENLAWGGRPGQEVAGAGEAPGRLLQAWCSLPVQSPFLSSCVSWGAEGSFSFLFGCFGFILRVLGGLCFSLLTQNLLKP